MWERIAEFFRRLLRRGPPQPGHFVAGYKLAWDGFLRAAPWVWPARRYLLYVPRGFSRWTRRPMLVLLHGCKQTPEELAAATRIAAVADDNGWLVLLPRQARKANPWGCWNWFDPATSAGHGEAAIVAAQVRTVRRRFRAHPRRIVVAGLSAGGALAAALGVRHPELFAGVWVHSGLACGAASSAAAALGVMKRGADTDTRRIGEEARAAHPAARVPLMLLHGGRDTVVDGVNAGQLLAQYLALNGAAATAGAESRVELPEARSMRVTEYRDGAGVLARRVDVEQLGHAWSGGDESYAFNDPAPPDATALLAAFVREVAG
jgi:poly(hydroxyalkanoate) depolymerase family esterase